MCTERHNSKVEKRTTSLLHKRSFFFAIRFSDLCLVLWIKPVRSPHDLMIYRVSKLTLAIPIDTTSSSHVVDEVFHFGVFPYGITAFGLTDNGVKYTSTIFATLCTILGVIQLTITAYHSQTLGQNVRYNRKIAHHYDLFSRMKRHWDP